MPQVSYGKGEWSNLNPKSIKTVNIFYKTVDLGYTSSQENTGKTYQDKFMSDKQFQLKNMRKILKKINCEKKSLRQNL